MLRATIGLAYWVSLLAALYDEPYMLIKEQHPLSARRWWVLATSVLVLISNVFGPQALETLGTSSSNSAFASNNLQYSLSPLN